VARERDLGVGSRCDSGRRVGESDEEAVSLRIDLDAPVACERVPEEPPVVCEYVGVVVAELVQ
jgi:hypothetical protein